MGRLPESNAACWRLASGTPLIPQDRFDQAHVLWWMFFEQYNHELNIATLRFSKAFVGVDNLSKTQRAQIPMRHTAGQDALTLMGDHLATRRFLGDHLSLADICLYAYTHVAGAGGFDLACWPAVERWCAAVAATPG